MIEEFDLNIVDSVFEQTLEGWKTFECKLKRFSKEFSFGEFVVPSTSWLSSGLAHWENVIRVVQVRDIDGPQNVAMVFGRSLDGSLRTFIGDAYWTLPSHLAKEMEALFLKYGVAEMDGTEGECSYTCPENPRPLKGFLIKEDLCQIQ